MSVSLLACTHDSEAPIHAYNSKTLILQFIHEHNSKHNDSVAPKIQNYNVNQEMFA
jgi:hypothetical protein